MTLTTYHSTDVNGLKVFYRESGPSDGPKLLLLHGYPSASHMFRNLIPRLADRFLGRSHDSRQADLAGPGMRSARWEG